MQKQKRAPITLSLRQEIEREAQKIEEKIAQHPELDQIQVTEEMDKAFLEKIRAYEKEVEEERRILKKAEEEPRELRDGIAANSRAEEGRDSGKKGVSGVSGNFRGSKENVEFSEELVPDLAEWSAQIQKGGKERKYAGEDEKGKVVRRRTKRKYWVVSLVAVLVIVLGVGMNSVGSKSYWKMLLDKILGTEPVKVINVEDMEIQETEDGDELTAYREIKEKLNIKPVRIFYKPDDMKLVDYEIHEEILTARLLYKYQDEVIKYILYVSDVDSSWGEKEEDIKINDYTIFVNDIEIKIEEFLVHNSSENRQVANFQYQGVHYQLKGIMQREEFNKILENLYFF